MVVGMASLMMTQVAAFVRARGGETPPGQPTRRQRSVSRAARLLAREVGGPLLQEGPHPFLGVLAGAEEAEEGGFEELALFEGHLQAVVDGFDGGSYCQRAARRDLLRHLFAGGEELIGGGDAGEQAELFRGPGVDPGAGAC